MTWISTCVPPRVARGLAAGTLIVIVLSGCGDGTPTPPPTSAGTQPAAGTSGINSDPTPDPPPEIRTPVAETPALSPELEEFFALIMRGQTGPARVRLRKHLNLHPDDAQAQFLFALSYHREKKYAEAVPWFERATADPDAYPPVHHFHGWALYYLGRLDESRAAFERHLNYTPNESDSHFALGIIALDEGRFEDAHRIFPEALRVIDPESRGAARQRAKTLSRHAEVFAQEGDHDQARTMLEEAVALFPDLYEAWFQLHRLCLRMGDGPAAADAQLRGEAAQQRARPGS